MGFGVKPTRLCVRTAAGELQVAAAPRLLRHPHGQGQHPGAGCGHPGFPAPAGELWRGRIRFWGGTGASMGAQEAPWGRRSPPKARDGDGGALRFSPRLSRGWPCPWTTAPCWAPRRASSAASSPFTGFRAGWVSFGVLGGVLGVPHPRGGTLTASPLPCSSPDGHGVTSSPPPAQHRDGSIASSTPPASPHIPGGCKIWGGGWWRGAGGVCWGERLTPPAPVTRLVCHFVFSASPSPSAKMSLKNPKNI